MKNETNHHDIVEMVELAKASPDAADSFIRQYLGFIKSEMRKQVYNANDETDELSISLLAFYEAIESYNLSKGNFLSFASLVIKSRLIDFHRKEKRHKDVLSLDNPIGDDDQSSVIDTISDTKHSVDQEMRLRASQEEIKEFEKDLASYGITFSEVSLNSPKQDRTLQACSQVVSYAHNNPHIFDRLVETKKLPMKDLVEGSKVSRKTIENHRKYLIAILVAFTNGYEMIRGHLSHLSNRKGGAE